MELRPVMHSFEDALREQGYTIIFAIGFKEEGDDHRIKIAATPVVKQLSPETWDSMMYTIIAGMEKLYDTPMDDLEFRQ